MARKTAIVKLSGNLVEREDVLEWLASLAKDHFVVICVGGGTQINDEFAARGFPIQFGPLGRETRSFEERQVARDILEKNRDNIQDLLDAKRIPAIVVIPCLEVGSVLCHVNGDIFVLAVYLGFDRVFVLTLESRAEQKRKDFCMYPKIEVVEFPD